MTTVYDSDQILVGGASDVFVAPVGTAFPTTITGPDDDFGVDWLHLGLTTDNGVKPGGSKTISDVRSSQRFYPTRKIPTAIDETLEMELQQWNAVNIVLAFGGGEITEPSPGIYKYTPPAASFLDERAMLVRVVDGARVDLWGYTRLLNTKAFQTDLVRTKESVLPIGMSLLDPGEEDPWFFLSNDSAFAPTGS